MKQSANPSAIRSKRMLTTALLSLMQTKPYHEISIKEIAEASYLNRRTFYRNFKDKDDILFQYGTQLVKQLGLSIQSKETFSFAVVCETYFEFWEDNIEYLRLLQKNNLLYFLFEHIEQYHEQLHFFLPYAMHKESSHFSAIFALGGFFSILIQWLKDGATQSPSQMATQICNTVKDPFEPKQPHS